SSGSNQDVYEGLDLARVGRARHADAERAWLKAVTNRDVSWALIGCPTERWAQEALGEPDIERLWDAVAHPLRLAAADPPAARDAHRDPRRARVPPLALPGPGDRPDRGTDPPGQVDGRPRHHPPRPGARREPPDGGGLHEPAQGQHAGHRAQLDAARAARRD